MMIALDDESNVTAMDAIPEADSDILPPSCMKFQTEECESSRATEAPVKKADDCLPMTSAWSADSILMVGDLVKVFERCVLMLC